MPAGPTKLKLMLFFFHLFHAVLLNVQIVGLIHFVLRNIEERLVNDGLLWFSILDIVSMGTLTRPPGTSPSLPPMLYKSLAANILPVIVPLAHSPRC